MWFTALLNWEAIDMGESPTSLKIALGLELKRLRLKAGLKPEDDQRALA